jgi:hypothetical protein
MAVTAITPAQLAYNTASADLPDAGGTAIDAADTMSFVYPKEGKLLIELNNTFAGSKDFTFTASDFGVARGQGNLVIAMAQDDVRFVVLESSRFKHADGKCHLGFAASTTGFVKAFYLP